MASGEEGSHSQTMSQPGESQPTLSFHLLSDYAGLPTAESSKQTEGKRDGLIPLSSTSLDREQSGESIGYNQRDKQRISSSTTLLMPKLEQWRFKKRQAMWPVPLKSHCLSSRWLQSSPAHLNLFVPGLGLGQPLLQALFCSASKETSTTWSLSHCLLGQPLY